MTNPRTLWIALAALLLTLLAPTSAALPAPAAKLDVVATTPDLAFFAEAIGGDRVDVKSLAKGRENLHALVVKPRTIVAMSRADLLLENGLSLEATWLPDLILASRNKALSYATGGRVNCSAGFEPLEQPTSLSRKEGDVHPEGNPHFTLSPLAGRHVAGRVLAGLVALDPDGRELFEARHAALVERLDAAEARWARYRPLFAGKPAVVYHQEFDYLIDYLGMQTVATLEPKPGIAPTPAHIARVIGLIDEHEVPVVLTAPWSNNRSAGAVAAKSGAEVLELPALVGGAAFATDWFALIDGSLERLCGAYGIEPPKPPPADEESIGGR
ncbi:MAG: metal ABC transporter substrate-binding protein [Planctomycetota bacterium]|nr:metal ABC transporter substrate-binding protein [Planctomycetota bacterium]